MWRQWGLGPVFACEWLTASRRWQVYAGRALLAFGLLAGLGLVWLVRVAGHELATIAELASLGRAFFMAIMGVELVLVLMVAPASAAGAFAQDKARGRLTHLLATDLSDAEIVLGTLAARLVTVLGIIACALPVQALASFLGGVDPAAVLAGTMVIAGVAVLGVSVALTFSVWATKPHESLMATYAVWAIWLLALLVWQEGFRWGRGPTWFEASNPFWLLFTEWPRESTEVWGEACAFLGGSLAIALVLAIVSVVSLRAVTLRRSSRSVRRPSRPRRLGPAWARRLGVAAPALDDDPVLWREWHRKNPAAWGRAIWRLYAALCTIFTLLALVQPNHLLAPGVNGFQVSIGLLLVSVLAATPLAEERAQGSLDVVMATPLSTREIVLGKWWGAFRAVPWLAILPAGLILAIGLLRARLDLVLMAPMLAALVLAYGMAVTSLGLLYATWQPRLGRAVALSVTSYLAVTVVLPTILITTEFMPDDSFALHGLSPFMGAFWPTAEFFWGGQFRSTLWSLPVLPIGVAGFALAVRGLTLLSFDRRLGRVPERGWPLRSTRPQRPTEALIAAQNRG